MRLENNDSKEKFARYKRWNYTRDTQVAFEIKVTSQRNYINSILDDLQNSRQNSQENSQDV